MNPITISSQPTRPFPSHLCSLHRLLGSWTDQRGRKESFQEPTLSDPRLMLLRA
jgi:hypothetical protein